MPGENVRQRQYKLITLPYPGPNKQKYISVSRRSKPTPKHTILRLHQVVCKLASSNWYQRVTTHTVWQRPVHDDTPYRADSDLEAFSRYPTNIGMQKEPFRTLLAHSFDPTVPLVLS